MKEDNNINNIKYIFGGISVMTIMALMTATGAFMVGKTVNNLRNYRRNQGVEERVESVLENNYEGDFVPEIIEASRRVVYSVPEGYVLVGKKGFKSGSDASNPDNYIEPIKNVVYSVPEGYRLVGLMGVKVPEAFSTIPEGYELKIEITDAIKMEKDGKVTYYAQEGGILVGNKSLKYYIVEKEKTRTMK